MERINSKCYNVRYCPLIIGILLAKVDFKAQIPPYPHSEVIKDIKFLWHTHNRLASGSDNWPLTWTDDDNQYLVWGDGGGYDI